uniref:Uncharacterized protein n=1 Tax=Arundo donax TaxID=35708 RepID=A0A0A9G4Q9_ARUDO
MSTALMERQPFCTLSCRRSSDRTAPVYLPAAISTTLANPLREELRVQKVRSAGINCFHRTLDHRWFEANTVLEVSFHNVLFFAILALIMAGIKEQNDPTDKIHHGGWMAGENGWPTVM